jgi:hypothetical protein
MIAATIREGLLSVGWKQVGDTDSWIIGSGFTLSITTDEIYLLKQVSSATGVNSEYYPIADLTVQDLAKIMKGEKPAGFCVPKPKVGEAASLF